MGSKRKVRGSRCSTSSFSLVLSAAVLVWMFSTAMVLSNRSSSRADANTGENKGTASAAHSFPISFVNHNEKDERIKLLERELYLAKTRSFRLGGNTMQCSTRAINTEVNPGETSFAMSSELVFTCFPRNFKLHACMHGKVKWPPVCQTYHSPALAEVCHGKEPSCTSAPWYNKEIQAGQLPLALQDGDGKDLLQIRSDGTPVWSAALVDFLVALVKQDEDISPTHYPMSHMDSQAALRHVGVKGKSVFVMGSISPWLEAIVIAEGSASTNTVDFTTPENLSPFINTIDIHDALKSLEVWDVMISFSSLEHDGLGRYGDPWDPDGDLAAVKEYYLKLKPGGHFVLGVPMGREDRFMFYSQRFYGPHRLPLLVAGFEYLSYCHNGEQCHGNLWSLRELKIDDPVLILRKPMDAPATLDELLARTDRDMSNEFACNPETLMCGNWKDVNRCKSLKCSYSPTASSLP